MIPQIPIGGAECPHDLGELDPIGPHFVKQAGTMFLLNDAGRLTNGIFRTADGDRITVITWRAPDGAMPHGMGLVMQLPVEAARHFAAELIKLADMVEGAAAEQAREALAKAARK